jgi:hypothetical protein
MSLLQHQLDRLADNELSSAEKQQLFAQLDQDVSQWRSCAITLLEHRAMQTFVRRLPDSNPTTNKLDHGAGGTTPTTTLGERTPGRDTRAGRWLAVAAMVAVAFAVGRLAAPPTAVPVAAPTTPDATQLADAEPRAVPDVPAAGDVLTVWTVDRNGTRRSLDVPLVEAEWIDRELDHKLGPIVSEQTRSQFQSRGYDVESRRRYAPLMMGDGQSYLLPVEEARIVPVTMY